MLNCNWKTWSLKKVWAWTKDKVKNFCNYDDEEVDKLEVCFAKSNELNRQLREQHRENQLMADLELDFANILCPEYCPSLNDYGDRVVYQEPESESVLTVNFLNSPDKNAKKRRKDVSSTNAYLKDVNEKKRYKDTAYRKKYQEKLKERLK